MKLSVQSNARALTRVLLAFRLAALQRPAKRSTQAATQEEKRGRHDRNR